MKPPLSVRFRVFEEHYNKASRTTPTAQDVIVVYRERRNP